MFSVLLKFIMEFTVTLLKNIIINHSFSINVIGKLGLLVILIQKNGHRVLLL